MFYKNQLYMYYLIYKTVQVKALFYQHGLVIIQIIPILKNISNPHKTCNIASLFLKCCHKHTEAILQVLWWLKHLKILVIQCTRLASWRQLPCKHAVSCQYRACTGPMLPASAPYMPGTGPYRHVYRVKKAHASRDSFMIAFVMS